MPDQTSRLILKYEVDQASANALLRSTADTQRAILGIADGNGNVSESAAQTARSLKDAYSSFKTDIDADNAALKELRDNLQGVGDDAQKVNADGGGGGLGSLGSLRAVGRAADQLGLSAIGQPIQKLGDVAIVAEGLSGLATSVGAVGTAAAAAGVGVGALAVAALPVAAAVGGVLLAFKGFSDTLNVSGTAVKNAITYLDDYYAAIKGGTTTSIKDQIRSVQAEKRVADEELKTINDGIAKGRTGYTQVVGDLITVQNSALYEVGKALNGNVKDLDQRQRDLQKQSSDLGIKLQALQSGLGSTDVKANDLKESLGKLSLALNTTIQDAERAAQAQRDAAAQRTIDQAKQNETLVKTGTTKGIRDRLAEIQSEREAIKAVLEKGGLSASKGQELQRQYSDLGKEMDNLRNKILPLVQLRERETAAIANTRKEIDDLAHRLEAQDKLTRTYNAETVKIEEQNNLRRAEIEKSYADKRVEIALKATQAAQDSLRNLEQHQTDLTRTLGRDLAKEDRANAEKRVQAQINFQREEVKDTTDHLRKLQDIRRAANVKDQEALLDRNFVQLAKNRLSTNEEITRENTDYRRREQDRVTTLRNQQQDEARAAAVTRQERLISYGQQEQDAKLTYTRELETQRIAKARELEALRVSHTHELTALAQKIAQEAKLRQQGYQQELTLLQQSELQKAQLQKAYQLQAAAQLAIETLKAKASQATSDLVGGFINRILKRADGGALGAGQWSFVNEPGSSGAESFTANGRTVGLPGFGLFMPSASGTVNANRSGSGVTNVYNISGNDPHAIMRALEPMIQRVTLNTLNQVVS